MAAALKLLVTGCTGYVGHQLARRLVDAGFTVLGSSRRPTTIDGVEVAVGDHLDPTFVASIVARCDAVLHLAARTRGHSAAVFARDNEAVTEILCRQARRHGARFVFASSDQAVYQTGFYGRSKRACEDIVARETGEWVNLRLSAVLGRYAPGTNSTFSKIIARLHGSRLLVVPGDCQFPIAPVWIGDIEEVVRALLTRDTMPNETLELCGPQLTLARLIDLFEARLGVRRARLPLPLRGLQAAARVLKPLPLSSRLPLDALLDLGSPVRVSPARLAEMLDFEPTPMEQAVPLIEDFPRA